MEIQNSQYFLNRPRTLPEISYKNSRNNKKLFKIRYRVINFLLCIFPIRGYLLAFSGNGREDFFLSGTALPNSPNRKVLVAHCTIAASAVILVITLSSRNFTKGHSLYSELLRLKCHFDDKAI